VVCRVSQHPRGRHMADHGANRRRSERVFLQINVLLSSAPPEKQAFQTQAFTLMVNAHGGLLESPVSVAVNQKITLTNPRSGKSCGCRVVRIAGPSESQFKIAFEFDEPNARFWPIAFPPAGWNAR
jgi:hypothetical protein